MDGVDGGVTFTDRNLGGSAHTWTPSTATVVTDDAQFKFGPTSAFFDGTGDWLSTGDHADFNLGTSDWSIDCWVRPAADGTQINIAGQCDSGAAASSASFYMIRTSGNKINVNVGVGAAYVSRTGATNVLAGAWYHVEATRVGQYAISDLSTACLT